MTTDDDDNARQWTNQILLCRYYQNTYSKRPR